MYWAGAILSTITRPQSTRKAWRQPETIVVNEIWWNATAKYADIVLPATTTLERNDIGASGRDRFVLAMKKAVELSVRAAPILRSSPACKRTGCRRKIQRGRNALEWLEHMHQVATKGRRKPDTICRSSMSFGEPDTWSFQKRKRLLFCTRRSRKRRKTHLIPRLENRDLLADYRQFDYDDCRGHPMWFEPDEWLGEREPKIIHCTSFPTSRSPDCTGRWITPR